MEQELTNRLNRIRETLSAFFSPDFLEIVDDSARHAGHAGANPAGESHYSLRISAPRLTEMGRLQAHRAINDALSEEFDSGLHALSIRIVPAEDNA